MLTRSRLRTSAVQLKALIRELGQEGYCASHSRCFWGLRPHLVCTSAELPAGFALADPKLDEGDVAIDIFESDPALTARRDGQTLIAGKGYASAEFETRSLIASDHQETRPIPLGFVV